MTDEENDLEDSALSLSKVSPSKRISSLFDGFISGLMLGAFLMVIALGSYPNWQIPSTLTAMLVLMLLASLAILVRGLYTAIAPEKGKNTSTHD